jgi:hypothetical protein
VVVQQCTLRLKPSERNRLTMPYARMTAEFTLMAYSALKRLGYAAVASDFKPYTRAIV